MQKKAVNYFLSNSSNGMIVLIPIAVLSMVGGGFMFSGGLPTLGLIAWITGLIMIIIGLISISGNNKEKPLTGEEYDKLVINLVNSTETDPREYLGLSISDVDEIDPISFEGYKFDGATRVKKDNLDNIWRSDIYEKGILFFTQNEIHIYKLQLNAITENVTETTEVFFYNDVVSVSTKTETVKIGNNTVESVCFVLTPSSGTSINIALSGNENRQKAINKMRTIIKEKKTL